MKLDARSERNLVGVHPDLVKVVRRAAQLTDTDFTITCGPRTIAEQRVLVRKGASKTMNSRHIPGKDGKAKAVDLAAMIGKDLKWDWPLYFRLAAAMKLAAKELKVPLEWGGDWRSFKDGPHFQLPHKQYP
jgi:peptidoglycan L-alanyl-D-glutamate endopeptidase CwlK